VFTQRLPVLSIPEALQVSAVWHFVICDRRWYYFADRQVLDTPLVPF